MIIRNTCLRIPVLLLILANVLLSLPAAADDVDGDSVSPADNVLLDMSLEDLLNIEVEVASRAKESIREAAGVITVITREDIERNQCRDMIDVLNMVPGFTISTDMFETGALVSRGLYGFEGRALFMVDGMQMNNNYFGNYVLGDDFPIHLVERIEIIRGPGSVMYGGAAELAVINIITLPDMTRDDHNRAAGRYGILATGETGHRDLGFNIGHQWKKLQFHLLGSMNQSTKAVTSDRRKELQQDPAFPQYDMDFESAGSSDISLAFSGGYEEWLVLKGVYQRHENNFYNVQQNNGVWEEDGFRRGELFEVLNLDLSSTLRPHEAVAIIPGFTFHYDTAWYNNIPEDGGQDTANPTYQIKPWLRSEFNVGEFSAMVGGEYFTDFATVKFDEIDGQPYEPYAKPGENEFSNSETIWNYAFFGNMKYTFVDHLTVSGGLRFDHNEISGWGFSPRGGLNLVFDRFHTKLLYSSAFRAPNIANSISRDFSLAVENNTGEIYPIEKETTQIIELEIGVMPVDGLMFTANIFAQVVDNIIEYNPEYDYHTKNGGKQGSSGIEAQVEYTRNSYDGLLNASWVEPGVIVIRDGELVRTHLEGQSYLTPEKDDNYLNGVPKFKLYTNHSFQLNQWISLQTNLLLYSTRYQHRWSDAGQEYSLEIPTQFIVGFGARFHNVGVKGLDMGLSVHDFFNEQLKYVSTFDTDLYSAHPFSSVNHKGREVSLNVTYDF